MILSVKARALASAWEQLPPSSHSHPADQLANLPGAKHLQAAGQGEQSQRKRQFPNKGGKQVWISMICLESGRGHQSILQIKQSLPKHTPVHIYPRIHPARPHCGTSVRSPTLSLCTVKLSRAHLLLAFFPDTEDIKRGFPGGSAVPNPPANAGDTGSIPGPGRSHMPQSN